GESDGWRELDQHVEMVVHAADLVDKNFLLVANAGEIGPRPCLLFFGNQLEAVFCAEYDVQKILNCRVRQWVLSSGRTLYCVAPEGACPVVNVTHGCAVG